MTRSTLAALLFSVALPACAPVGDDDSALSADDDDATAAMDTWDSFAADWFATYCVSCHFGDNDKDFTDYASVVQWQEPTRCGVAPTALDGCGAWPPAGQFPVGSGPFPDATERERLVAWIDLGLPE